MPAFTHHLAMNREEIITLAAGESLSLVDAESYRPFIGPQADRFDLMAHLSEQTQALTAFTWDVPPQALTLRFLLTGDHQAMERITFSHRPPSASGTVRTQGNLCLLSHDQLVDCARNSDRSLRSGGRGSKEGRPHLFKVPPGIFYVLVYYRLPYPDGVQPGPMPLAGANYDYTVFLHHYPHPAPRVAPVRLPGGLIPWAGEEAAGRPWGGSHKMPQVYPSGQTRPVS